VNAPGIPEHRGDFLGFVGIGRGKDEFRHACRFEQKMVEATVILVSIMDSPALS
jgi:hypothetical protein